MKKESIKNRVNRLFGIKLKSKIAALFIDSAIKIIIGVVCGALFLSGIYLVGQKIVLPSTESAVVSMFNYENDNNGDDGENNTGTGGSGGVETPDVGKEDETIDEPVLNEHGFYYNQPYSAYIDDLGGEVFLYIRDDETLSILSYTGPLDKNLNIPYTISENNLYCNVDVGLENSIPCTCSIISNGTEIYLNEFQANFTLKGKDDLVFDGDYAYIYDDSLGGYVVVRLYYRKNSYVPMFINADVNGKPVVKIGDFTFSLSGITELPDIPNSITVIGERAFAYCDNLTIVNIPDKIITIEEGTFMECHNITSITIPNSVTSIESDAFNYCNNLSTITFKGTKEQWKAITFGEYWNNDVPATEVQCSDGSIDL